VNEFERYAPAMALFYGGSAMTAAIFGHEGAAGGSPVTPEMYGPAVYAVPAVVWIAVQFSFGAIAALGCWMRWRMVAGVAGMGTTVLLAFFAVASLQAEAGTLLTAGTLGWLAPLSALGSIICLTGARDGR